MINNIGSLPLCLNFLNKKQFSTPGEEKDLNIFQPYKTTVFPLHQHGEGADRDLRDADTRGSPPGSRDRRMAAWSQHSPDHSDRRMTCVAVGTVLYSLKCSHLHNLQDLWSEPAIWYSLSLHLKERQAVQVTAWHRTPPCKAADRL